MIIIKRKVNCIGTQILTLSSSRIISTIPGLMSMSPVVEGEGPPPPPPDDDPLLLPPPDPATAAAAAAAACKFSSAEPHWLDPRTRCKSAAVGVAERMGLTDMDIARSRSLSSRSRSPSSWPDRELSSPPAPSPPPPPGLGVRSGVDIFLRFRRPCPFREMDSEPEWEWLEFERKSAGLGRLSCESPRVVSGVVPSLPPFPWPWEVLVRAVFRECETSARPRIFKSSATYIYYEQNQSYHKNIFGCGCCVHMRMRTKDGILRTFSNGASWSWATLISPRYMNSVRALSCIHLTPGKILITCVRILMILLADSGEFDWLTSSLVSSLTFV